jgi:hypothetical protein
VTGAVTANAAGYLTRHRLTNWQKFKLGYLMPSEIASINSSTPRPHKQNVILFQHLANARPSAISGEL